MFSGGKKWIKKILKRCCSFSLYLLCLFSVLCSSYTNVSAISPDSYNVRYSALAGAHWMYDISAGYKFGFDYLYNYEWLIAQIPITGNTANIHFETNVVLQGSLFSLNSRFHNTDLLTVKYCGSTGHSVDLKSVSVSSVQTDWNNSDGYKMRTLTIYADVVATGFSNGSSDLYCNVGLSNNWAFAAYTNSDAALPIVYIEQQPTRVSFTNDNTDAFQQQQIAELNNISRSLDNIANSNDEMDVYEREQADLQDKGDELSDDADDVGVSANLTPNPFTALFYPNPFSSGNQCITTLRLHQLFDYDSPWTICSPYPNLVRQILGVVSSLFLSGLLIRLYYKHLKGGFNG